MNRSRWIRLFAPRESRSPNAGDADPIPLRLIGIAARFRVESKHWIGTERANLVAAAATLDAVRNQVAWKTITPEHAQIWIDAGAAVLETYQRERSRRNHPAGKGR